MYVAHLTLRRLPLLRRPRRSPLEPGATAFIGRNGQGKTNLVEAIDYLSRLSLAPGRRRRTAGAGRRRTAPWCARPWSRDGREAVLEVEINPGGPTGRGSTAPTCPRARELRRPGPHGASSRPTTWRWSRATPPSGGAFLDDLLVLRAPRLAGVRADYDRVLKQRNSLLKTAGDARRGSRRRSRALSHARRCGTPTWRAPAPSSWPSDCAWSPSSGRYVGNAYATVARGADAATTPVLEYQPSLDLADAHRPRRS